MGRLAISRGILASHLHVYKWWWIFCWHISPLVHVCFFVWQVFHVYRSLTTLSNHVYAQGSYPFLSCMWWCWCWCEHNGLVIGFSLLRGLALWCIVNSWVIVFHRQWYVSNDVHDYGECCSGSALVRGSPIEHPYLNFLCCLSRRREGLDFSVMDCVRLAVVCVHVVWIHCIGHWVLAVVMYPTAS